MSKYIITVISFLLVGVLSASPMMQDPSENIMRIKKGPNKQRCSSLYSEYYQSSLNKTIQKEFLSAAKAYHYTASATSERKYTLQKAICWDFLHQSLSRMEDNLPLLKPCTTLQHQQTVIFNKFEAFLEFLCTLNREEFRSFVDVEVIDRLIASKARVENCFESTRKQPDDFDNEDDFGIEQEVKPKGIDFCSFNIIEAMTCVNRFFEDPQDLVGFEAYTNFFAKQFTCASYINGNFDEENFYATLFDHKSDQQVSFYGDFLRFIEDFFAD